jgi:hypothetical protein
LFGATNCACGYNTASSTGDDLPIELSYWESLRAYWRVYWAMRVLLFVIVLVVAIVGVPGPLGASPLLSTRLQIVFGAAMLFLFVPRICSRPYRGFSLTVVEIATGATTRKMRLPWRTRVWLFLWWRQVLAGVLASLLAMPLNALLTMMGLQVATGVAVVAGVLVIGPILLKMLIGHQFDDFRIEARRTAPYVAVLNKSAGAP